MQRLHRHGEDREHNLLDLLTRSPVRERAECSPRPSKQRYRTISMLPRGERDERVDAPVVRKTAMPHRARGPLHSRERGGQSSEGQ